MIYEIQAAKDVKLSNIARALNEDISLIKTELKGYVDYVFDYPFYRKFWT